MAVDRSKDMEALNAFVDGELSAEQRAVMAARIAAEPDLARAHATLAQLRASLSDFAGSVQPPEIGPATYQPALWPFAAAAAAILAVVAAVAFWSLPQQSRVVRSDEAAVQPVALGNKPMIPDLSAAGLTLVRVDGATDRTLARLTAAYTGPRGCRLELHVRPLEAAPLPMPGATHRKTWDDGTLAYDLFAFGMPQGRFLIVADAAERQTRALAPTGPVQERLREARRNAPPCVG